MEAVRTQAGKAVDAVDTGAAVVAGVDGALVDVNVTHGACAVQRNQCGAEFWVLQFKMKKKLDKSHTICKLRHATNKYCGNMMDMTNHIACWHSELKGMTENPPAVAPQP